jgi:hypothetical protein
MNFTTLMNMQYEELIYFSRANSNFTWHSRLFQELLALKGTVGSRLGWHISLAIGLWAD